METVTVDLIIKWFVVLALKKGKYQKAKRLIFKTITILRKKYNIKLPVLFMLVAVDNITPKLKFIRTKIAGRKTLIPTYLGEKQGFLQGIRQLLILSRRKPSSFSIVLAQNLVLAYKRAGAPFAWQMAVHRLAVENRPNLRFIR